MTTSYNKVSIIGAGYVGSTTAYTLMMSNLVSELVIVDRNKEKAIGEEMDLNHGLSFTSPAKIIAGEYKDISNSDIVIITAGVTQKLGESRLDLVKGNVEIFKQIIPNIIKHSPDSIILVVTNPVDILTYVTKTISGIDENKIIGSGTVLDTSRFKYLLGKHTGVDVRNVHAYILGEHGDSEVPIWSKANIASMNIEDFCNKCSKCNGQSKYNIFNDVKNAGYETVKRKGTSNYAISLAVKRIVECVLKNENSILTVSSIIKGQYGINDVCLSLPSIVNNKGVNDILEINLSNQEKDLLHKSAEILKNVIKELEL